MEYISKLTYNLTLRDLQILQLKFAENYTSIGA